MKKIDENTVTNVSDLVSLKLFENSINFLTGEITEENVGEIIKWLVYEGLDQKKGRTLTLYINSTGGDLYQALALIDIMRTCPHPIRTVGLGAIMSAAFLIFAAGTKGHRYITRNSGIMCHQFSSSTEAKYHDLKAEMKETESLNSKMISVLKDATGMTSAAVKRKLLPASDVYLTAEELIELKIADQII